MAKLSLESKKNRKIIKNYIEEGLSKASSSGYLLQQAEAYLLLAQYYGSKTQEFKENVMKAEEMIREMKHAKLLLLLKKLKEEAAS